MKQFMLFSPILFALSIIVGCDFLIDSSVVSVDKTIPKEVERRGCITEFKKEGNILVITALFPAPIDLNKVKSVEIDLYFPDKDIPEIKSFSYHSPNEKGEWEYKFEFPQSVRFAQLFLVE